ncbi:MAG: asparagine synthase (glutamine-hydrolyzing) [Clostridiales bacterium]|nr:asparagine synthase (glutamine-hydrolyzing) [Clostridiales bacterium]
MCGFVGFVDKLNIEEKQKSIKLMADRIIHRGPDAEGYFTDEDVALGHRRLSIIDLSNGIQPMYNEDKSIVVVFNGEIYNYKDIKKDLENKGHTFQTNSDTEVLVHGYEEYKEELFNKLRGMFSFVIYDIKNKELIGVRDFFGIKPFYYYKDEKTFMFGSEIKSFLEHPYFVKEVNKKALKPFLTFQYSVLDETFFKNTYRLRPGNYIKYKNGEIEIKQYFKAEYLKQNDTYENYKKQVKESLEDSVKCHQISDVEVGSYLSGGVDSSYIVSMAKPDKTFTVGFDKTGFDESGFAKDLSKIFNTNNYNSVLTGDDYFNILPVVQYHTDEPHANLSTVPLYFLSKLAREKVKVVLSGEGADEMYGGYNELNVSKWIKAYCKLPLAFRKALANKARSKSKFKGKRIICQYDRPLSERFIGNAFIMDDNETRDILCDELKEDGIKFADIIKPYYDEVKNEDEITQMMYINMHFWLAKDMLLKADKMSMANSVELRVPFLDKEVWEVARKIPSKYLIKNGETKKVFRDVAAEVIPEEWAKRRKLGFPVPFFMWIKEEKYFNKVKELFMQDWVSEFFDKEKINKMLDDHYAGVENHGRKLYNIYIFLVWYNVYFVNFK